MFTVNDKITLVSVNGGVKAGHWGGAKTGQFAAWHRVRRATAVPAEMAGVS
jgi:hypothetical protein